MVLVVPVNRLLVTPRRRSPIKYRLSKNFLAASITAGAILTLVPLFRAGSAFDVVSGVENNCVWTNNNVCATCENTKQAYQCQPGDMPKGFGYGRCLYQPGKCADKSKHHCGQYTYTCGDPREIIKNDPSCNFASPDICKKE